jgi:hypothetical protein
VAGLALEKTRRDLLTNFGNIFWYSGVYNKVGNKLGSYFITYRRYEMAVCKWCGVELEEGINWYRSSARKKCYTCKSCNREQMAVRRATDAEFVKRCKEYHKEYINDPENKKKANERIKKWREANREHIRARDRNNGLKWKYGIGSEEFNRMFQEQGSVCAICGTEQPDGKRPFMVDHDHTTGKVRGILCNNCNMGLGWFKDKEEYLTKAIEYLKETT